MGRERKIERRGLGQTLSAKRVLAVIILVSACMAGCSGGPSTLDPQGPDASRVAGLWWLMFGVAAVVFLIVFGLLVATYIRARRVKDAEIPRPNDRRAIILVLLGGAVAPLVVLLIMMGISIGIENANIANANSTSNNTIEVIGHEWWWEVRYPNQNFVTANEVHIPVQTRVLVKLTTADVIHSFWVPQLHGKVDLIPGQTNSLYIEADNPGTYRGECAEFCGLQHAHMDFLVVAESQADYDAWVAQQQKPPADIAATDQLVRQGQQAFLGSACVYCHTIRGTNASGTLGPDLTHLASRQTIGAGILLNTRGNLAGWIVNSQAIKPGNRMPPMYLDADQIQQILAYLETLK